ncbi:DUF4870 domain-containing protein [[Limnothrix rosea] IAM M-220]|uniref:DUF4870 domain-containing protein n=1 Tax=[Limnothrix rosea] IAM M-220 TaxID=454133 RepID=UPI00095D1FDC|nr:DUF4870 domain-containing protein [[Limnothrix rosea] IAM M-220]OKH19402.1 hypothetical protein NIES208_02500 [[Limnothrix rosea] IAM M-220]
MTFDPDKRKLLSALCHGATFINYTGLSIGIPIAILLTTDDPVVKVNARESLNFHFNMWIYFAIGAVTTVLLIGFLIIGLAALASFIMPIIAILAIFNNEDTPYKYPFIFHFL